MPDSIYWTVADLKKRYNCSSRTIARWRNRETNPLPKPVYGPETSHGGINRWDSQDILDWEQLCKETATG